MKTFFSYNCVVLLILALILPPQSVLPLFRHCGRSEAISSSLRATNAGQEESKVPGQIQNALNPFAGLEEIGEKAESLQHIQRLGISVPKERPLSLEEAANPRLNRTVVDEKLRELETATGTRLGGADFPLLMMVRSSSDRPYHGGLHTIMFVGLTRGVLEAMRRSNPQRSAADRLYVTFLESWGNEVLDIPGRRFDEARAEVGHRGGAAAEIAEAFERIIQESGQPIPLDLDPMEQAFMAIEAVVRSGDAPRILAFRQAHGQTGSARVAAILTQALDTFADGSGIGILSTHDPATGEERLSGDFVLGASGLDLMKGRGLRPIAWLERDFPEVFSEVGSAIRTILNDRGGFPQDIEFAFQRARDGRVQVSILQAQAQQALSPAALLRLAEQRNGMKETFVWEQFPALLQEGKIEPVPQREVWITRPNWPWMEGDGQGLLIGTIEQTRKLEHPGFGVSAPLPAKHGYMGWLVWSEGAAAGHPRDDPLIFLLQEENQDTLQELLFANRVSAIVVPAGVALRPHNQQMARYFGVPVIPLEASAGGPQPFEGRVRDGALVIFSIEGGVVMEFSGWTGTERQTEEEVYKGTRVRFLREPTADELNYAESFGRPAPSAVVTGSFVRERATPRFDPWAVRDEVGVQYNGSSSAEITDAFRDQLWWHLVGLARWRSDRSSAAADTAVSRGLRAAFLFQLLRERGGLGGGFDRQAVLLDAMERGFQSYRQETANSKDLGAGFPLSNNGYFKPLEGTSYQIFSSADMGEHPVIAFWHESWRYDTGRPVDLTRDSAHPKRGITPRLFKAEARVARFFAFLEREKKSRPGDLASYRAWNNWYERYDAIDFGEGGHPVVGVRFNQRDFREVVRLLGEFEQEEAGLDLRVDFPRQIRPGQPVPIRVTTKKPLDDDMVLHLGVRMDGRNNWQPPPEQMLAGLSQESRSIDGTANVRLQREGPNTWQAVLQPAAGVQAVNFTIQRNGVRVRDPIGQDFVTHVWATDPGKVSAQSGGFLVSNTRTLDRYAVSASEGSSVSLSERLDPWIYQDIPDRVGAFTGSEPIRRVGIYPRGYAFSPDGSEGIHWIEAGPFDGDPIQAMTAALEILNQRFPEAAGKFRSLEVRVGQASAVSVDDPEGTPPPAEWCLLLGGSLSPRELSWGIQFTLDAIDQLVRESRLNLQIFHGGSPQGRIEPLLNGLTLLSVAGQRLRNRQGWSAWNALDEAERLIGHFSAEVRQETESEPAYLGWLSVLHSAVLERLSSFGNLAMTYRWGHVEEWTAARTRVENTLTGLADKTPAENGDAAVIGPSLYRTEPMRFLQGLVERALGPIRQRIFFDTQDPDRRSAWAAGLLGRTGSPSAQFLGSDEEFRDFQSFLSASGSPISVRPADRIAVDNPVLFVMGLLQSIGLRPNEMGEAQRQELEQDLAFLIEA